MRYTVTGTHEPLHNFAFAGKMSMRKSARCVKHACTKSHALRPSTAILRGAVSAAPLAGVQGVCNHRNWASLPESPPGGFLSEQRTYGCGGHGSAMVWVEHRPAKRNCPHSQGGQVRSRRWRKKAPADAEKNRCEHRAEERERGSLFRVTEAPFPECHASAGGSVTGL